jgi:hypothetical protein
MDTREHSLPNNRQQFRSQQQPLAASTELHHTVPHLDEMVQLLTTSLQTAIHQAPSKALTVNQLNQLPIEDMAKHLEATYIISPSLSERDIHQIRFILHMYKHR